MKSIEKSVEVIYRKADRWESEGKDSFISWWQATLEIMLLLVGDFISERPGQMASMEIEDQNEWEFFLDVKR